MCVVDAGGTVLYNRRIKAAPQVWAWAIAHCLLHLGMDHMKKAQRSQDWNAACDCAVEKFLSDLKFGGRPEGFPAAPEGATDENRLYERLEFMSPEEKKNYSGFGTAGDFPDMLFSSVRSPDRQIKWASLFAQGLRKSVAEAVAAASGASDAKRPDSRYERARAWFINSYPLLGVVASRSLSVECGLRFRRKSLAHGDGGGRAPGGAALRRAVQRSERGGRI
jgi:hypothetical protein